MNKLYLLASAALALAVTGDRAGAQASFDPATGTIVDSRWQSGVPLGGIGDGKIELMTDGSFGNFSNQANWDRCYPWAKGAFAAVRAQAGDAEPVARILRLKSDQEYAGVENVAHTRMQGWFPKGQIAYDDPALPVKVRLNAFSPLVPHNVKDSCMPVACLDYTLTNTTGKTVKASFVLAWPNLIGYGGTATGLKWDSLEGDRQSVASTGALAGLRYTTSQHPSGQQQNVIGQDFVGVRRDDALRVQTCVSWDAAASTPSFWSAFAANGTLPVSSDVSSSQPAGAVAASAILKPGESRTLHYYVVWAMPHMVTMDQAHTYTGAYDAPPARIPGPDNHSDTGRWSTNQGMHTGDHMVLDLGSTRVPTMLDLNSGNGGGDYPRGLRVESSVDGQTWTTVSQIAAQDMDGTSQISLVPTPARYVKLTNLGNVYDTYWSISGLGLRVQGQDDLIQPVSATAYLAHADIKTVTEDTGHYWQNFWKDDLAIAAYADRNHDRLLRETDAWQSPVRESGLPFWLKLKLINCAFPMFSNTALTKDGRFCVLESPNEMGGALGTMDQRIAAHAFLTAFFPELDRAELELFAQCQQADGQITHFDGNVYKTIGNPNVTYGITGWPDLSCGWVTQVVNLYRWTGDGAFRQRTLPHIHRAMAWLKADGADDALIPTGGSTYDYESMRKGAFIYSASCYLGALRAASAVSDPGQASEYDALFGRVQKSVMDNLWTGTYFRKWAQPSTGRINDDSFIANLAGDWMTRVAGLPSTLDPKIVHQSLEQTIARHQKPFFPMPPMQTTPDGRARYAACFSLQHEPFLGCEAIYGNFVDDGLDTIRRVYLCAWEENQNPWDEPLMYDAPNGHQGGLPTYMTAPTSWFVLDALSGASIDVPKGLLYLSPRLTTGQHELHIPVFLSRFWARLDYVPEHRKLTLTVTRAFAPDLSLQKTLYHAPGVAGDTEPESLIIGSVAANGDSRPIGLPRPFIVHDGAVLDLSPQIAALAIPQSSDTVDFEVKAPVLRPGLPADKWTITDNVHANPVLAGIDAKDALDGDPNTKWTTGRALQPGDSFTLDMAVPQQVAKIVLDNPTSPGDYPDGYRLDASMDGQTWTTIAQATEQQTVAALHDNALAIAFTPVTARYLRVTSAGGHYNWWSVDELSVFAPQQ
jgi:uncharacterized protein (DUF608 family)